MLSRPGLMCVVPQTPNIKKLETESLFIKGLSNLATFKTDGVDLITNVVSVSRYVPTITVKGIDDNMLAFSKKYHLS